jgi:hypothetical protein
MRHSDTLNEQLQTALNTRVVIEQAKGKLAERLGLDMDQAFSLLRDFARACNLRLSDLAQAFVSGSEPSPARPRARPTASGKLSDIGTIGFAGLRRVTTGSAVSQLHHAVAAERSGDTRWSMG